MQVAEEKAHVAFVCSHHCGRSAAAGERGELSGRVLDGLIQTMIGIAVVKEGLSVAFGGGSSRVESGVMFDSGREGMVFDFVANGV